MYPCVFNMGDCSYVCVFLNYFDLFVFVYVFLNIISSVYVCVDATMILLPGKSLNHIQITNATSIIKKINCACV